MTQTELPFAKSSATSRDAAMAMKPNAARQEARVLEVITKAGWNGATDDEIQVALGLMSHSETPRRWILVKKGLVIDSGVMRRTRSGRAATVWTLACHGPRGAEGASGHAS